MAAPAQTPLDAFDPSAPADPIALAAFVSRRGGRVVAYLDAVTAPDRALHAAGEAFATYRQALAADPDDEPTALLRAVRRAATVSAENPFRPDGRERPARRTRACEAMPRLLVAWTEARLPDGDVGRLIEHLQECPDCRALRDAFDRAEIGFRGDTSIELDGTEVGVITTAMALATPAARTAVPERAPSTTAPSPATRPRRTAIPAAPSSVADHLAKPSGPAPVGRRTAIPAAPTAVPLPPAAVPLPTQRPRPRRTGGGEPGAPEDPLGPEALGYAVPRSGLPRPDRRPAVPRVKRRRARRPASAAVEATAAVDAPTTGDSSSSVAAPRPAEAPAPADTPRTAIPLTAADASRTVIPSTKADTPRTASPSTSPAETDDPAPEEEHRPAVALSPATITGSAAGGTGGTGRLSTVGRQALQMPVVRQLGVPAVLLLAVLIAALIAAGAFAGDDGDSVEPITRPTISTVPSNAGEIPPLR